MGLREYQRKRHFERTPEPKGGKAQRGGLHFVIQKHDATRLHYDFRLECHGVLKSWAVPKGPSLNPADKRLAVKVEDHPLDYASFEGVIPEGNYGAGPVIVWDRGTYTVPGTKSREEAEDALERGLQKGHVRVELDGKKLHGGFSLIHLRKDAEKNWLLVKGNDDFASDEDILSQDRSVVSKKTIDQVSGRPSKHRSSRPSVAVDLSDAPRGPMPTNVKPMLATLGAEPFDREGWIFEVKWDGFRAVAEVNKRRVRLYSRNLLPFDERFAPVVRALEQLGHDAVLDGEVVALDERGRPQFQLLQNYQKTGNGLLVYYVFDILHLDGHDLRNLPLVRRKELLAAVLGGSQLVCLSEHVESNGVAFFQAVSKQGLEGMIAKDGNSVYREGRRSDAWVKIKSQQRQEAVIGGFTAGRGSRKGFGALVLGLYEGNDLVYIGHTGGGFDGDSLAFVKSKLDPLVQEKCPFRVRPKPNAPVTWVRPELVCEVRFSEWTGDGLLRHPIFLGLRPDKPAGDVRREEPTSVKKLVKAKKARRGSAAQVAAPPRAGRQAAPEPKLSNLQKVYWPEDGYTKGDLIDYYRDVAELMLPYLRDRPQSLHRYPNGINGESFFQKDMEGRIPEGMASALIASKSGGETKRYLLCQDMPTLLFLANLGCIEINPYLSRVGSLDRPDHLVIDLDPEAVEFDLVVEAAQAVRKVLDKIGAACVCKTSGKRGLHIYVPLGAQYDYDQAKQFAEIVANVVHRQLPKFTSVLRSPSLRQGKVYLDFLQNRLGQTLAAAYSVRPVPGARVSTPLAWKEVRRGLDPSRFTIKTVRRRVDKVGDLWKPSLGPGLDLAECLRKLERS